MRELSGDVPRLRERPGSPQGGGEPGWSVDSGTELLVGQGGDRVDRQPPDPGEIELHVVAGKVELLEVGAHGLRRDTFAAEVGHGGGAVALRELLAVRSDQEPVVDVLGRLRTEGTCQRPVQLGVRQVVAAPDDVRDRELRIVYHRGEVVRGAAVRPQQRRIALALEPDRTAIVVRMTLLEQSRGGIAIETESVALPERPLVPDHAQPFEVAQDAGLGLGIDPSDVGVVDPQGEQAGALVGEAPVRDRGERRAEMEGPGRAGREAHSDHARNLEHARRCVSLDSHSVVHQTTIW